MSSFDKSFYFLMQCVTLPELQYSVAQGPHVSLTTSEESNPQNDSCPAGVVHQAFYFKAAQLDGYYTGRTKLQSAALQK